MSSNLQIAITAEVADLQTKMALAKSELAAFNAETRKLANEVRTAGDAADAGLRGALERSATEAARASAEIARLKAEMAGAHEESEGLAAGVGEIREGFAVAREAIEAMVAALAIEKIAEWIGETSEAADKVERLTHALGISAEEFTGLAAAARLSGVGEDEFAGALERLEKQMGLAISGAEKQQAEFAKLGITLQDLKNKNPAELFQQAAEALDHYADGVGKTTLAQELMGRTGANMIGTLGSLRAGLDEARRTGTEMSEKMVEDLASTHRGLVELSDSVTGVSRAMLTQEKPAIDAIVNDLASLIQDLDRLIKTDDGVKASVDAVAFVFKALDEVIFDVIKGFQVVIDVAGAATAVMVVNMRRLNDVIEDYRHLDFTQMGKDWKTYGAQIDGIIAQMDADVQRHGQEYRDHLQQLWGAPPPPPPNPEGEGAHKPGLILPPDNSAVSEAKRALDQWFANYSTGIKLQITEARNNSAEQIRLVNEWIRAGEAAYPGDVSKYGAALEKKAELTRQFQESANRMAAERTNTDIQLQTDALEAQVQDLDAEVASHQITAQKKFEIEKELYEKIWNLQKASLQAELQIDELSAEQKQKIVDKIQIGDQRYQLQRAKLSKDAAQAEKKDYDSIASAAASGLMQMIQGRETFAQVAMGWGEQLLESELKRIAQTVIASIVGDEIKTTSKETHAAAGKAAEASIGSASVLGDAYKAAAGTYAALAEIPVIGPVLAPIAAAGAFAAVMAFDVFSAEGGWGRVPMDGMPTLLHANEMVLPADLAAGVRSFALDDPVAAVRSRMAANTGAGGDTHNHNYSIVQHVQPFPVPPKVTYDDVLGALRGSGRDITRDLRRILG